jgi:uncharacterized RmlC-like cupin family protein
MPSAEGTTAKSQYRETAEREAASPVYSRQESSFSISCLSSFYLSSAEATPGTVVRMPANVPHAPEATARTKLVVVMRARPARSQRNASASVPSREARGRGTKSLRGERN